MDEVPLVDAVEETSSITEDGSTSETGDSDQRLAFRESLTEECEQGIKLALSA